MIQPAVRGNQQLIEGALFPLPRHREGGDDKTAGGGDDGHQGRQDMPVELDVGVVEVAHRQLGLPLPSHCQRAIT
jgi:hypothetical protein